MFWILLKKNRSYKNITSTALHYFLFMLMLWCISCISFLIQKVAKYVNKMSPPIGKSNNHIVLLQKMMKHRWKSYTNSFWHTQRDFCLAKSWDTTVCVLVAPRSILTCDIVFSRDLTQEQQKAAFVSDDTCTCTDMGNNFTWESLICQRPAQVIRLPHECWIPRLQSAL